MFTHDVLWISPHLLSWCAYCVRYGLRSSDHVAADFTGGMFVNSTFGPRVFHF